MQRRGRGGTGGGEGRGSDGSQTTTVCRLARERPVLPSVGRDR